MVRDTIGLIRKLVHLIHIKNGDRQSLHSEGINLEGLSLERTSLNRYIMPRAKFLPRRRIATNIDLSKDNL